jgi:protein gp37
MSETTSIEWTDTTWNPTTGCTKVTPGCDNCYAEKIVERFHGKGAFATVTRSEPKLWAPFKWRKPRKVFVNSMSDLFHDQVPDSFIVQVFSVMARTPQHTYQLLTKRHGRMRSLLNSPAFEAAVGSLAPGVVWPMPNLWLGVSVEDQKRAELRIRALIDTPAAIRWLSCEPLLGPIDLARTDKDTLVDGGIDWVVVGGESGHGARAMHPDWARGLRDQCTAAGVPFFFKQWGEWRPGGDPARPSQWFTPDGHTEPGYGVVSGTVAMARVGKKAAGRVLDGQTWDEFPAELQEVASRG